MTDIYSAQDEVGTVQFLVDSFTFLGFQVQHWMLIVAAVVAAYAIFSSATNKRE